MNIKKMSEKITMKTRTICHDVEVADFGEEEEFDAKFEEKTITCNQCSKEFECHVDIGGKAASVCNNPECPDYALYQVPLEIMPKQEKEK